MNGRMDGWTDGCMDGWMDGHDIQSAKSNIYLREIDQTPDLLAAAWLVQINNDTKLHQTLFFLRLLASLSRWTSMSLRQTIGARLLHRIRNSWANKLRTEDSEKMAAIK